MEETRISFISLNIEGSRHLERVRDFVLDKKPDVVCMQEVLESNFEQFKKDFGMDGVYFPMTRLPDDYRRDAGKVVGLAIFSKLEIKSSSISQYYGPSGEVKVFEEGNGANTEAFAVLKVKIVFGDKDYDILTTHFVWTHDGEADEHQREALKGLFSVLEKEKSFILCGDFNAPRGREIFTKIASVYKDNIPAEYESSIDPNLHRKNGLRLMVDGLFSTSDYRAENVKLVCGVSDHCAVTANISKT